MAKILVDVPDGKTCKGCELMHWSNGWVCPKGKTPDLSKTGYKTKACLAAHVEVTK